MQVSWVVGLAELAKKGLDEHMLTLDSHKPRRSMLNKKVNKFRLVGRVGSLRSQKTIG